MTQASQIYAVLSMTQEDEAYCKEKGFELPWASLRDLAGVSF